jgi:hypothetical protein
MTMVYAAGLSGRSRSVFLGRNPVAFGVPWVFVLVAMLAAGCSTRPAVEAPSFSPDEVAQRAIAQYDKNGDGALDATEVEQCPGLQNLLKELDRGKDEDGKPLSGTHRQGKLTADEIAKRLEDFQATHIGRLGISCRVKLDGDPLVGATVTLVPEAFLGESFKRAGGVSDDRGYVRFQIEGQEGSGVACGYYRIEVSKLDNNSQETLPARYNKRTMLGREVSPLARVGMMINLNLTSS